MFTAIQFAWLQRTEVERTHTVHLDITALRAEKKEYGLEIKNGVPGLGI